MRIKQVVVPLALIVPVLLAFIVINPSQPTVPASSIVQPADEPGFTPTFLPPPAAIQSSNKKANTQPHQQPIAEENFDSALALSLMSEIALDENGNPIADNQLKQQLDNAVRLMGSERSPAELDKLGELITQAFKPHTAQAINHILFQYYAYKMAEQNYTSTLSVTSSEDVNRNTKALTDMRESYLGHELAGKLFSEDNNYHTYMAELTERLSATDLTEDARNKITRDVQKKYYPNQEEISRDVGDL